GGEWGVRGGDNAGAWGGGGGGVNGCATELAPAAAVHRVLEQTGYREWLRQQADGPVRLVHLEWLRSVAERAETDLGTWLAHIHLDQEGDPPADHPRVLPATIHSSKGREWPIVFLVGLEEGILPHARALASSHDDTTDTSSLEDERRVFFVGLTTPRYVICLSYCRERRAGDVVRVRRPS